MMFLSLDSDFMWETLASLIVNIGGGIGSFKVMLLSIAKNKELSFTIFDIKKTIEHARTVHHLLSFHDCILHTYPLYRHGPVNHSGCKNVYSLSQEILWNHLYWGATSLQQLKVLVLMLSDMSFMTGMMLWIVSCHSMTSLLISVYTYVLDILKNVQNAMLATSSPNQKSKLLLIEMMPTETSSHFMHMTSLQLLSLSGGIMCTEGMVHSFRYLTSPNLVSSTNAEACQ